MTERKIETQKTGGWKRLEENVARIRHQLQREKFLRERPMGRAGWNPEKYHGLSFSERHDSVVRIHTLQRKAS